MTPAQNIFYVEHAEKSEPKESMQKNQMRWKPHAHEGNQWGPTYHLHNIIYVEHAEEREPKESMQKKSNVFETTCS